MKKSAKIFTERRQLTAMAGRTVMIFSLPKERFPKRLKVVWVIALLSILGIRPVLAQTIISPSNPDSVFISGVTVSYMNSALVLTQLGDIRAVVWDDVDSSAIAVNNDDTTESLAIAVPGGYDKIYYPDVALMGPFDVDPMNPSGETGVIYLAKNLTSGIVDVFLNIYNIQPFSTPMNVITYQQTYQLTTSGNADFQPPHIDIVAGNFFGRTLNDDDNHAGICVYTESGNVIGYYNLNMIASPSSGTIFTIGSGSYPDVAAVFRTYSQVVPPPNVPIISTNTGGLFAYVNTSNHLAYAEWDTFGDTIVKSAILDNGTITTPRIDAIGDTTISDNTGIAHYDVVYKKGSDVYSYTDKLGSPVNCSSPLLATNGNPTVACGVDSEYTIAYYSSYHTNIYAQTIDWHSGTLTSGDYYQVNTNSGASSPSSVSKVVNESYSDSILVCWYNATNNEIDYKLSGDPIGFKHNPAKVESVAKAGSFSLCPNPAASVVTLQGNSNGDSYRLTDITGRSLISGDITGNAATIHVGMLPAGMYLVNIFAGNNRLQTLKFVKK